MSKKHFYIWILIIVTELVASAQYVKVLRPLDKSLVDEEYLTVVIERLDPKVREVRIQNGTKVIATIRTDRKRRTYCKTIPLHLGINHLRIHIAEPDIQGAKEPLIDIFVRSEVHEEADEAPPSYTKHYFHTSRNEKHCSKCHNMKPDNTVRLRRPLKNLEHGAQSIHVLDDPARSHCYNCHKALVSRKNDHSPAVNMLCTICHTGESGEFNTKYAKKSKYLMPDPIAERCFVCHTGLKKRWYTNKSQHGPLKTGRCDKCHNPHASNYAFFLRKPIYELCTTCHSEKAEGKHVLGSFVFNRNSGAHPLKGRPDPSRPGRNLTCSSCHNPHGSNGIYLLRTNSTNTYSICQRCHKK